MNDTSVDQTAYRSDEPILRARLETLLVKRDAAREEIVNLLSVIHTRRARILAGRCGLIGGIATAVLTIAEIFAERRAWAPSGHSTLLLLGSAALSVVVYGLGAADPFGKISQSLATALGHGDDLRRDVERLSSDKDLWALREEALSLEQRSVALPLGASALLMPLVLHFFCGLVLSIVSHSGDYVRSFDGWILLSIGVVGAAHTALVVRAGRFATILRQTKDESLSTFSLQYGWRTLGWVTLYACLPGAIFLLVPVAIAALTGALIIPVLFARAGRVVARERAAIGLPPVR